MEENDQLQGIVEELHDRELALNQESCAKELQVHTLVNKCILLDEQKYDFSESCNLIFNLTEEEYMTVNIHKLFY